MRYVCSLVLLLLCSCALRLNSDYSLIGLADELVSITYSSSPYVFSLNAASTTTAPTVTSGVITSCQVAPALPTGLTISLTTCEISGTPTLATASTSFTVTPSSVAGAGTPATILIEVVGTVPSIAYSAGVYLFDVNQASTTGAPVNSGGTITGCSVAPALPTGLTLSAVNCTISGTPTVPTASANYTITPSNGLGNGADVVVDLTISNVVPDITFSPTSFSFNLFDAASTTGVPTNDGGAITSCAVVPALPAGLSVSQTTCAISGTPSAVDASDTYTVTPTNAIGNGPGFVITLEVNNVIPNIAFSAGSYIFDLNDAASTTTTPTNTGGAITGCIVSPALPTGLSINTTTCTISGTPTVVSANAAYTVTPSNAVGNGAARSINIAVSNVVPNIAYAGSPYDFNLLAVSSTGTPTNTGGAITGCIVSPALPTGLTIHNTNCTISGTPSVVAANASYTITASNAVGNAVDRVIDIEILNVVPSIAYSAGAYTFNLYDAATTSGVPTNSGGAITSCAITPALPAGLSISNTTCAITGTPSAVDALDTYTITPSNGMGNGADQVITIAVANVVPSITYSAAVYEFDLNDSAATTGAPTNTGGAITGCTINPALPTGLTINATTCAISGTPTVVTVPGDFTITASNGVGNAATVDISIEILNIVPEVSYSASPYTFTQNVAGATTGVPTNTGGAITSCGVSPTLPAGLSISSTTCAITGTPTAVTANASYTVTPSNAIGSGSANIIEIEIEDDITVVEFTYTGGSQNFVVPAGVTSISVKAWGGGGASRTASRYGGGAGFAYTELTVTPGETLTILVAGGGMATFAIYDPDPQPSEGGYNGGGLGGADGNSCGAGCFETMYGASGGGMSEVKRAGASLIIAAGGGGAGQSSSGGEGGGLNGNSGGASGTCTGGGRGDQSSGGSGGGGSATAGSASLGGKGGNAPVQGGGGGAGYFGGGGGSFGAGGLSCGGGGGSSYTTGTNSLTISGSGSSAGKNSDTNYAGAAGRGGTNTDGNPGRVVISY
jgi:hypothetical protein